MPEVMSSNVKQVEWRFGQLYVQYIASQAIYRYKDVPHVMYRALLDAESKGKYLNEKIKPYFDFTKVTEIPEEPTEKEKLLKAFNEIVVELAKNGLVRYELDEEGNARIVYVSFVCPKCGGDCSSILEALKKELK